MKSLALNEHALLHDGCRYATLESPRFTVKPRTPTQKEGDSSDLIANTEFVSIVEAKLNKRIDDLTAYVKKEVARLDARIDSCEQRLSAAESTIKTHTNQISSVNSQISSINSSLDSLNRYLQDLESRLS